VQAITSKWYNNTASTYYLLRNTKYLEDYVELAKLHKSGRTITHNLGIAMHGAVEIRSGVYMRGPLVRSYAAARQAPPLVT
jgi:hypothetical protein